MSSEDKIKCRRLSAPTSGSARRRARERRRAEQTRVEGERLARERREQRAREKLEQQRLACKELATYEPWGRAGGGAPNPGGVRFSDIRARGIYPEDELRGVSQYEACCRWPTPRRRHRRRTPVRLREDPQLCYAFNLRKSVDNDIRYKQTPNEQQNYRHVLDEMVNKRKKTIKEEAKRNLEYERQMHAMDGPWGKPGPGGTIWRNPRNVGLNFSKSMGWTDNEMFNMMKGDQKLYKRSSLTLPKVKRDDDSKENVPKNDSSQVEKLPDISHTNSANGQNKHSDRDESNKMKESNGNNVNGFKSKGSCGNGKGKRSPTKNKFVKRLSNGDRVKRIVPEDEYNYRTQNDEDIPAIMEKKPTPEETILRLTGGVELVPLLARRRRVGARTLPSSDVTRPPEQFCEWRELLNVDYLRELKHQIRVKCEQKEESRRDSAESVRRHHETWASLWGRPGHGAPQLRGRYARSNLAQLLYVTPISNPL